MAPAWVSAAPVRRRGIAVKGADGSAIDPTAHGAGDSMPARLERRGMAAAGRIAVLLFHGGPEPRAGSPATFGRVRPREGTNRPRVTSTTEAITIAAGGDQTHG